jgi:hypothetical protein
MSARTKPLSATMAEALGETVRLGGELIRLQGGYWTYPNCPRSNGFPDWYAGASTIQALVDRGEMEFTEWRDGRHGRFPIRVKATPRGPGGQPA